MKNEHDLVPI